MGEWQKGSEAKQANGAAVYPTKEAIRRGNLATDWDTQTDLLPV